MLRDRESVFDGEKEEALSSSNYNHDLIAFIPVVMRLHLHRFGEKEEVAFEQERHPVRYWRLATLR